MRTIPSYFIIQKRKLNIAIHLISRLGSSPELTGPVGMSALMGSPMIDLEKLFSGRETTSALEAVQAILFSGSKIKERNVAEGIRGVEDVQDLISLKIEVWVHSLLVALQK